MTESTSRSGNSPAISVLLDSASLVANRLSDARLLSSEYKTVVQLDSSIDHTVYESQKPENVAKNRYTNVLPYDYNMMAVTWNGTDSKYVNASTVHAEDRTSGMEFNYICSQGPLPSTIAHFWRMVLEQGVPAIVMLTNLVERGVSKCARYFPDQPGDTWSPGGDVQVSVLQATSCANGQMTERAIQVSYNGPEGASPTNSSWPPPCLTLRHFHYHAWPDHGTPCDSRAIRDICKALQAVRLEQQAQVLQHTQAHVQSQPSVNVQQATVKQHPNAQVQQSTSAEPAQQAPDAQAATAASSNRALESRVNLGARPCSSSGKCQALVHCSAGIGRTGTFLAVDIMIQRVRRLAARAAAAGSSSAVRGRLLSEAFNIPTLVHELRQQRMGMVQTLEQYTYIYRALQDELQEELAMCDQGPNQQHQEQQAVRHQAPTPEQG